MDLIAIDKILNDEVFRSYEGYQIEKYASGFGIGGREVCYDVTLKDGSRFVVDARYDTETNRVTISEREYVEG